MAYNKQTRNDAVSIFTAAATSDGHRLSADLKASIRSGQTYFTPETLYVKRDMTALGGFQQMLDATTEKSPGVSSFQGDRLPKKKAACYNGLRVVMAQGAADSAGKLKYDQALDAATRNAELIIAQNGREQIRIPVSDLDVTGTSDDSNENFYELPPNLLRDDEEIQIALQFANGATVTDPGASKKSYIAVILRSIVTK